VGHRHYVGHRYHVGTAALGCPAATTFVAAVSRFLRPARTNHLHHFSSEATYNEPMASQVPAAIHDQKYISLTTFRKTGAGVATPVWFGEDHDKLYVMTRSDMGKAKRIRNNPQVKVAPCTIRGKVTGPEFLATVRILPPEEHKLARETINRKYWMARLPLIWSRTDTYFEVTFTP
jgi:uncharacterized protein